MLALFFTIWGLAVRISHSDLFPTPGDVLRGIIELFRKGLLFKYIVASLFRVTWGFTLAVLIGVPAGLVLGWYTRAFQAFNPILQILRPISPIAWIPVAILWFGVSDAAPIFLIFLASVFPITVSAIAAIIDARNAGKRYDLVVAGMVMIGFIGLILDLLVRQLEKFDEVSWGYARR